MKIIDLGTRRERLFFAAMALMLIGFVLIGFWHSYFSRGLIFAPMPSLLVGIHGVLFVGWLALFVVQVLLIGTGRVKIHRRLGPLVAVWGLGMVLVGPPTVLIAFRRPDSGITPPILFGDLAQILVFAVLIGRGLMARRTPLAHKRLMLLGTAAIMLPALARWPYEFIQTGPPLGIVALYFLVPIALLVWDLATLHRLHRMTLLGGVLMLLLTAATLTIPQTAAWEAFCHWVAR